VPGRTQLARAVAGVLIAFTALVSVGLSAPADGPFTIAIRPVFLQLDPVAIAESRARALGFDIDIRLGPFHVHMGWSAISLVPMSTKTPESPL
jgi:hypothetical protein